MIPINPVLQSQPTYKGRRRNRTKCPNQDHATHWLRTYNNDCPYMDISGIRPTQKLKMLRKFYDCTPLKAGGLLWGKERRVIAKIE